MARACYAHRSCSGANPVHSIRLRQPAILTHLDDDLAFCAPRLEVRPSLFGGFEREDPIYDRPDDARFNERCDLAQLLAVRSHENKRIANAVVPGLLDRKSTRLNSSHP